MAAEPAHAVLFPYLWIRGRIQVGQYELVSRNVLVEEDFLSPWLKTAVEGLLSMYELRVSMGNRVGTVVRRIEGRIGDRFDVSEMKPLRRAVVAALLDPTPAAIGRQEDTPGWSIP